MKQEDKELLLKDLSARLPYGVILSVGIFDNGDIKYHNKKLDYHSNLLSLIELDGGYYFNGLFCKYPQFSARPYLRSMEDMTYEEEKFINQNINIDFYKMYGGVYLGHIGGCVSAVSMAKILDYLNAHHFDYRGLIERGLAIKVTPDNNPYE